MQTPDPIQPAGNLNPYAAPLAQGYEQPLQPVPNLIWRNGPVLVMHKSAMLPDVCIKSNEDTDGYRLARKMTWHHPAIAITLLVSPLIYIIVAAIVSKKACIFIPLTEEWRRKRKNRILFAWSIALLGLAGFIGGFVVMDQRGGENFGVWMVLAGIVALIFSAVYGIIAARLVAPQKIDDDYVYVKGAHQGFLARFPDVNAIQYGPYSGTAVGGG